MNPGQLRRKITIQQAGTTSDGMGGYTKSWTDILTTWSAWRAKSGSEGIAVNQQNPSQLYEVTIRYRAGIVPLMRLVDKGITPNVPYMITAVADPNQRKTWLKLTITSIPG
jgi:SPP1 family predicted phage head-tail adaptor